MTRENRTKQKPCSECGTRTESVTGLCAQHRSSNGAKLPFVRCGICGGRTRSTIGVCSPCQRTSGPKGRACTDCGMPTKSKTGLCGLCRGWSTGIPCQDESPPVLLDGWWRTNPHGVKVWVAA